MSVTCSYTTICKIVIVNVVFFYILQEFSTNHRLEAEILCDDSKRDIVKVANYIHKNQTISKKANIVFITAIYGNYERTCKPFAVQTIPTDFVVFTDNPENLAANGWQIDAHPYHMTHRSPLDNGQYVNSLENNSHTFNIAKYYKQAFQNIPRLKNYDVVVWVDGTVEITNPNASAYTYEKAIKYKVGCVWEHWERSGSLKQEVIASHFFRYTSTFWNGQAQPYQDIDKQYEAYIADGYDETFFKKLDPNRINSGVWVTCYIGFANKDKLVTKFLNMWYMQNLIFTTQDQVSFPYVSQKLEMLPHTLPEGNIKGRVEINDLFIKRNHGTL